MSRTQNRRFQFSANTFSSMSRATRRAAKSMFRAHRHDARWMADFRERADRQSRWSRAFHFIPLNLSRFGVMWASLLSMFAGFTAPPRTSQLLLNRDGVLSLGKGKKSRKSLRGKAKQSSAINYENLEPRQLLAADLFGSSTVLPSISTLTEAGDNTGYFAALEVGELTPTVVANVNSTAWSSWTAPASGNYKIDVTGGTLTDPVLGVYTGTLGSLTEIASDDDNGPGLDASLVFTATAGTVYHFQVSDFGSTTNQGTWTLSLAPFPAAKVEFLNDVTSSSEGSTSGGPTLVVDGFVGGTVSQRTVTIAVLNSSTTPADFISTSPISFVIPAGTYTAATFDLQALGALVFNNDSMVEGTEDFSLLITGVGPSLVQADANGDGHKPGTSHDILDDDTAVVSFTLTASTVAETVATHTVGATLTIVPGVGSTGTPGIKSTINVDMAQTGGIATGADFALPGASPMFSFAPSGPTTASANLSIVNDLLVEGNETIVLALGAPTGLGGVTSSAATRTVTITDDDTLVVTPVGASAAEASGGVATTFTLVFGGTGSGSAAVGNSFNISESTSGGTAVAPGDYTALSIPSYTVVSGSTSIGATGIALVDDGLLEGDETFNYNMSLLTNLDGQVTLGAASAVMTILDDETATVALSSATATLTETGGAAQSVPSVVLTIMPTTGVGAIAPGVTVSTTYSAGLPGTALSGVDYAASTGVFTFTSTSGLTLAATENIINDDILEGSETYTRSLSALTVAAPAGVSAATVGASLGAVTSAVITITDDESASLSIAGGSVTEPGGAQTTAPVTLTISGTSTAPFVGVVGTGVTVTGGVSVTGGTAGNPADYAISGTSVSFGAGAISGATDTLTVTPVNDWILEGSETIDLLLGGVTAAGPGGTPASAAGTTTATVTITDDEAAVLNIANSTVTEPGGAQSSAPVTLTITGSGTGVKQIGAGITVSANVGHATGTASAADYAFSDGSVSFGPLTLSGSVDTATTTPVNDFLLEGPESFGVTLSPATAAGGTSVAASSGTTTAVVNITDDESATVQFATSSSAVHELIAPLANTVGVTLTIFGSGTGTPTLAVPVTVTVNNTGGTANEPADYGFATQTVTFPATTTTGTTNDVNMFIVNDGIPEGTETAILSFVSGPTGPATTIGATFASHTVVIHDRVVKIRANDTLPVENVVNNTDTNPANNAQFEVLISTTSAFPTVVGFKIDPLSTATYGPNPDDFVFGPQVTIGTGVNAGVYFVTIPANATSRTFDIDIVDDLLYDPGETIQLTLFSITNGGTDVVLIDPAMPTDVMTIIDNETGPTVSVVKSSTGNAKEGNTPTPLAVSGQFRVQLDQAVDHDIFVTLNIGGDAIQGTDYNFSAAGGVITGGTPGTNIIVMIPKFTTSVLVNVNPIAENNLVELNETVSLTPASFVFAAGSPAPTGTVAIGTGASLIIEDEETATVNAGNNSTGAEDGANLMVTFEQTKPASTDTIITFNTVENADLIYGVDYVVYSNFDPGVVAEVEANNSIAAAQSLDNANWNLAPNTAIGATATMRPHITVAGTHTAAGNVDYYKLTLREPGSVSAIISGGGTFSIRNSADVVVTGTLMPGNYYVRVVSTASYTLHISADNVLNAKPTQAAIYASTVAGPQTGRLVINPITDTMLENDEPVTFTITSLNADGGSGQITIDMVSTVSSPDHIVTVNITDDDTATVSIDPVNNGSELLPTNGKFTITMTEFADEDVWVPFRIDFAAGHAEWGVGKDYVFGPEVLGTGTATNPFRVMITEGLKTADINIIVNDESVVEIDETVRLVLLDNTSQTNGIQRLFGPYGNTALGDNQISIGTGTASIIITDEDQAYVIVNSTIDNAYEGGADGQWTVTLALPGTTSSPTTIETVTSSSLVKVDYEIYFGSASAADITAPALIGQIWINPGSPTGTIDLSAFDDLLNEGTEDVFLKITGVDTGDSDVILDPNAANLFDDIFIIDNDTTTVKVSSGDQTANEAGTDSATFTFSLVGTPLTPSVPVTVFYSLSGTALLGTSLTPFGVDYTDDGTPNDGHPINASVGQVTIPAGSTSATITLPIKDDNIVDPNETIIVTITNIMYPGSTAISVDAMNSDFVTIIDNDTSTVSITADTTSGFFPAGEGTKDGRFKVELSKVSSTGVLVNYVIDTTPSGALPPHAANTSDYNLRDDSNTLLTGSVFIQPNQSFFYINVDVIDDAILEGIERVVVKLTGTNDALFTVDAGANIATVLIDADQTVKVTTFDNSATEGVAGATGRFRVSINRASTTNTIVSYTLSGAAIEGTDYATQVHKVTIVAGSLFADVTINPTAINDTVLENPEDVIITLTGVDNLSPDAGADITLSTNPLDLTSSLTIFDNDYAYVTIAGTTNGNEAGVVNGKFTLTLRDAAGNPTTATEAIVVSYSVGGTATPSVGLTPNDYTVLSGTVTILAGSSTAVIDVNVNDDVLLEGTETVKVTLTGVSYLPLLPLQNLPSAPAAPRVYLAALGGPTLMFQNGTSPFAGFSNYSGTLDTYLQEANSLVNASTNNPLLVSGAALNKRQALLQFSNIFGVGFGQIPIGSVIDTARLGLNVTSGSGNVTYSNMLANWNAGTINWANAMFGGNGLGGIQNDGIESVLGTSSLSVSGSPSFTPGLDVKAALAAWSAGAANFGWVINASGDIEFSSAEAAAALRPKLTVTLDTSATINILDNDTATLAIDSWTAAAEENTDGVVTVKLTGAALPVGYNLVIPYTVGGSGAGNGTALGGSDYTIDSGFITIIGGTDNATFIVDVLPDDFVEGLENVKVTIGTAFTVTPTGAQATAIKNLISLGTSQAFVDIIDEDTSIVSVSVFTSGSEFPSGLPGHIDTVYRISMPKTSTTPTIVSYTLTPSADFIAGSDYTAIPLTGTITLPIGASVFDFTIDVLDDSLNESDEFMTFTLNSIVSANPGISVATGVGKSAIDTIEDDDALIVGISTVTNAGDMDAYETPSLNDHAFFTISQNFFSDQTTIIPFEITGGSATLPSTNPLLGFDGAGNPTSADYTLIGGTEITWVTPRTGFATLPAGVKSAVIKLVAKQDFIPTEGTETVSIALRSTIVAPGPDPTLSNPNPPAIAGLPSAATANIIDETYIVSLANTDSPAMEDGLPSNGFNGQFTVSISHPTQAGNNVTVPFSVVNHPQASLPNGTVAATYGVDYTLTGTGVTINPFSPTDTVITGTVVIPGGSSFALITIAVIGDNAVEGYLDTSSPPVWVEDIAMTLGTPVTSAGGIAVLSTVPTDITRTETIIDNDSAEVTLSVVDNLGTTIDPLGAGIGEGTATLINQGAFRFSLNKPAQGRNVRVAYSIVGAGTTAALSDHGIPTSGFVTIPAGQMFFDLLINPVDDNLVEGPETLKLRIDSVTEFDSTTLLLNPHAKIGPGSTLEATATILDNDSATISISAIDNEALESGPTGKFLVTMSKPAQVNVVVTYTIGGGTDEATPGTGFDYVSLTGTVTILAGNTTAEIIVQALDDAIVEGDESVTVTLVNTTNLPLVTAAGSDKVFIRSDDVTNAVLSKVSNAFEQGTVAGVYRITLDKVADEDITFTLFNTTSTGLGFATTPGDYGAVGTITVLKGTLTGTTTVTPLNDVIAEGDETLSYRINSVSAPFVFVLPPVLTTSSVVTFAATSVDMTIVDNDVPVFSVSSVSKNEGTNNTSPTGPTIYTFTISLVGELAAPFTVQPTLSANTTWGNNTTGAIGYDYKFPGAGGGTAPGPFTFPAGAAGPLSTFTFTVEVEDDTMQEATETFTVGLNKLTTGVGAPTVSIAPGTGTIVNDDFVVYTIAQTADVVEGSTTNPYLETPPFTTLTFSVTPSIPVDINVPVTVNYSGGTATKFNGSFTTFFSQTGSQTLPFGVDYEGAADSLTFNRLSSLLTAPAQNVTVRVVQDRIVEGDLGQLFGFGVETFNTVGSSTATYTTAFNNGVGTIIDDDGTVAPATSPTSPIVPAPLVPAVVSVTAAAPNGDPDVSEGVGPFGNGNFYFSVTTPVQRDIVITYSYSVDGAVGDPNGDISPTTPLGNALGVGTITIPASVGSSITSVSLPFSAFNDTILEDNENVVITITGISTDPNVTFNATPATATIFDDDKAQLSITAIDGIATEGSSTDTATFRVSLSQVSDTPTTVNLILKGSSGLGLLSSPFLTASDYSLSGPVSGSGLPTQLTIPANTSFVDIIVTGLQDSVIEGDENLAVAITYAGLGNGDIEVGPNDEAFITIKDDGDGMTVNVVFVQNGNESGTDGIFRIQLLDSLGNPAVLAPNSTGGVAPNAGPGLQVNYLLSGVATQGTDYTNLTGLVVIPEGQSFADVTIDPIDDLLIEGPESVILTIQTIEGGATYNLPGPVGPTAGELISIGVITNTLNIIDNDFVAATVAGVYVRSAPTLFSDIVDNGVLDSSMLGYNVTNSTATVPLINADEIVVQFSGPVTLSSLNFVLTGIAGTKGVGGPASVPTISSQGAFLGPNNAVILPLSTALEASRMHLQVTNGTNVQDFDFLMLPGDYNNDQQVSGTDLFAVIAAPAQGSVLNPNGSFSTGYELRKDVNGDGAINGSDLFGILGLQNSLLPNIPPAPAPFTAPALILVGSPSDGSTQYSGSSRESFSTSAMLVPEIGFESLAGSTFEDSAELKTVRNDLNRPSRESKSSLAAIDGVFSEAFEEELLDLSF